MARKILTIAGLAIAWLANAQDVEEIIERHLAITARSCDSSFLQSSIAIGEACYQGSICFPLKVWSRQNRNTRLEMNIQSAKFLIVSNDSLTWEYNPANNENSVVPHDQHSNSFNATYINNDLISYPKNGYQINFLGEQVLDSLDVYVLELTKTDHSKTIFINKNSFLINKIVDRGESTYFLNYLHQDGLVHPGLVVYKTAQQSIELKFTKVEHNTSLHDSLFTIPHKIIENHFLSMEGTDQEDYETLVVKGNKFREIKDFDQALIMYNQAIKINAQSEVAFNSRGLVKIDQRNFYDAISDFTRALEINKQNTSALNNRGLAKYYLQDFGGAIQDFNLALKLDPQKTVAYTNRGLALLGLKKYKEANADFSLAISHDPLNGSNYLNRGITLAELEQYDKALKDYQTSLSLGIRSSTLYNYKGVSEFILEQYDSAEHSFTNAILSDGSNLQYRENLARTYYEQGKYHEANSEINQYLKESPDNDEIINLHGLCNFFQEHYKIAIKHFSKAIEVNPTNATYFDNRAEARQNVYDYEGAIKDYDESIKLYPNDPETFYKRGLVKILTSKKYEGCLDLATANEMEYHPAKEAIMENCN